MEREFSGIKVVVATGDARERGRRHGSQAAVEVAHGIEAYMDRFAHFAGMSRQEACTAARRYVEPIRRYDEAILEELAGIAEGADRPLDEVLALNCRSELMYTTGGMPECTSFGLMPDITSTGHTYVGQNWDWAPDTKDRLILLVVQQDPRPAILLIDEAGMVGRMGLNAAGIGLASNTLIAEHAQIGVPYNVLLRGVLNSANISDALAALVRPERALGANFLVGDGAGQVLDIEASSFHVDYISPRNGIITHGNHFAGQRLHGRDMSLERFPDSLYRECRLRDHFERCGDAITWNDMVEGLCDSFGSPNAIRRSVDSRQQPLEQIETVASFVLDVTERTIFLCKGQPDASAYARIEIDEVTAEVSAAA